MSQEEWGSTCEHCGNSKPYMCCCRDEMFADWKEVRATYNQMMSEECKPFGMRQSGLTQLQECYYRERQEYTDKWDERFNPYDPVFESMMLAEAEAAQRAWVKHVMEKVA